LAKYASPVVTPDHEDDLYIAPEPLIEPQETNPVLRTPVSDGAKQVIINQSFWEDVKHAMNKNMYEDAQRLLVA
jgi:hypothetical protein